MSEDAPFQVKGELVPPARMLVGRSIDLEVPSVEGIGDPGDARAAPAAASLVVHRFSFAVPMVEKTSILTRVWVVFVAARGLVVAVGFAVVEAVAVVVKRRTNKNMRMKTQALMRPAGCRSTLVGVRLVKSASSKGFHEGMKSSARDACRVECGAP